MDVSFSDNSEKYKDIDLNEKIHVQPVIKCVEIPDIIKYVSGLQNEGHCCRYIYDRLLENYHSSEINKNEDKIGELFGLEGLVGTVFIDARILGCKEALKHAKKSPYYSSIQGILGCNCGTNKVKVDCKYETNENDFFATEQMIEKNYNLCSSTNIRQLQDLSEIETENLQKTIKQLKTSGFDDLSGLDNGDILMSLKNAFTTLMNPKKIVKKIKEDKNPELVEASFNVDIENEIQQKEKVSVAFKNEAEIEIEKKRESKDDLDIMMNKMGCNVDIVNSQDDNFEIKTTSKGMIDIDKKVVGKSKLKIDMHKADIDFNAGKQYASIDITEKSKGNINIELANKKEKELDVLVSNTEEIALDKKTKKEKQINVVGNSLVVVDLEKKTKKQSNLDISLYGDNGKTIDVENENYGIFDVELGKQDLNFDIKTDNFFSDFDMQKGDFSFDIEDEKEEFNSFDVDGGIAFGGNHIDIPDTEKPFEFTDNESGGLFF